MTMFQDWKANSGNLKGRIVMVLFRIANGIRRRIALTIFFFPYLIFYRLFVEWFLNIEMHWNAKIGAGLRLEHGHSIVLNGSVRIGRNCTLRHNTTVGNKRNRDGSYSSAPRIGNNVEIGVGAIIIGDISIGSNTVIGAGSVVTKDVPDHSIVVGMGFRYLDNYHLQS